MRPRGAIMRNVLKFFIMLPMVLGSMVLAAILVGLSVAVDAMENNG